MLAVGFLAAAGVAAATALRGAGSSASGPTPIASEPSRTAAAVPAVPDSATTDGGDPTGAVQALAAAAPVAVAPVGATATRRLAPVIPPGRTALRDTLVAERAGDTVRVRFDLVMVRTRRADKFESIVRSTLPQVYGAPADSALQALPAGAVTRAGDLTTTLAERGLHIPLADGRTISVWPEVRPGRDGPLVVAYRTVASR